MRSPACRVLGRTGGASRVLAVVLAVSLAVGSVPIAPAQEPEREARVTATVANVRATASPTGKVLFQLKQGERVKVLDLSGRWVHITDAAGRTGYVFGTLVAVSEVPAAAPAAPAAAPVAAGPLKIEHDSVGCIVAEQHPKLDACFLPPDSLGRAQIHFRAQDSEPWYAVELKREGPCFSAYLPKPNSSTREFRYYVNALDRAFSESQQPAAGPEAAYRVRVVKKEDQCAGLGRIAAYVAKAATPILVSIARDPAGKVVDAAAAGFVGKAALAGFSQSGVVTAGAAGAAGATAGTTTGGGGAAAAGGLPSKALLIGGLAAAAVGVAVVAGGGGGGSSSSGSSSSPTTSNPQRPTTVTGIWAFSLRCQGQTTVVAQSNVTLNQTSGGAFNGSAPGTDYTGESFTLNISGNYTANTGVLNGEASAVFANNTRVDNFTTTLASTDTGFISTNCTQNCGCPGEIRFNRLN
jgi:hypothetical protein